MRNIIYLTQQDRRRNVDQQNYTVISHLRGKLILSETQQRSSQLIATLKATKMSREMEGFFSSVLAKRKQGARQKDSNNIKCYLTHLPSNRHDV